jgi:3-deoxy-D-manno-octulosonate 8-phosphate phosphatase (KDO 8-P phosphatase)
MAADVMNTALIARAQKIRLIAFDVDGVMTDGTLFLADDGQEYKGFNSLDGHGLKMLKGSGIELAIITGRSSRVVEHRAKNLGIEIIHQGAHDKLTVYEALCRELNIECESTAYMGDDWSTCR